jgi:hypothetical protein
VKIHKIGAEGSQNCGFKMRKEGQLKNTVRRSEHTKSVGLGSFVQKLKQHKATNQPEIHLGVVF